MAAVLFRVGLLAVGMGIVEIGLGDALTRGSPTSWAIVLLVGIPLIVAGTAGFMAPLLGGRNRKGTTDA